MSSFPLYKKRDFGEYMSDTFQFFRKFWKNYLLNFITLNGALLLILCLIYFFIFKDLFGQALINPTASPSFFTDENAGVFAVLFTVGALIAIIFTVITTAYPIVYLRLVASTDRETFTASEILNEIKKHIGRIIIFGLLSIFTFIPLIMIFFILSAALVLLLVGIPLLILGMGAAITWINQSLYVYLNEEVGYFEAMGAGWRTLFSKFWHIVGSSTLMIFILYVISFVVSIIPYSIMMARLITTGSGEPDMEGIMPLMVIIYVINIIFSYIFSNLIYINQGLIYYSGKETEEHVQAFSEIDTIGRNEE